MKRYVFILAMFILKPSFAFAETDDNNSDLFDKLYTWLNGDFTWIGLREEVDRLFNGLFDINWIYLFFGIICLFFITTLFFFLKELVRKESRSLATFLNDILPETAFLVFSSGMALYYLGYAYGGTGENALTLLLRSMLSSFEMFLSKSNLIGIAGNCRESQVYMFLFAFFHAFAVIVSMIFAVTCFGKRVKDMFRGFVWQYKSKDNLHVFWGLNEKSILLAKNIYQQTRERIVFVDFPQKEEENRNGQGFSGILGLLSYKINITKRIADVHYLLLRSPIPPSAPETKGENFLCVMNIRRLGKIIRKAKNINFYILTEDESSNLQAALNMLDSKVSEPINKVFCLAKENKVTALLTASTKNKLRIIDDSKEAIVEFARRKSDVVYPINYVDIDTRRGCVKPDKPFTALLIGFGKTGQETLRFLYEFSAFADSRGKKTPVRFHIFDSKLDTMKGDLYRDIPALPDLEDAEEITFYPCDTGTVLFNDKLHDLINSLNYVVIATGDDSRDLCIAATIYEYALQHRADGFEKFKILVRLYHTDNEDKFQKAIEAYADNHYPAIEYFGSPQHIYTKAWILDEEEEKKARQFSTAYEQASQRQLSAEQKENKNDHKEKSILIEETKLLKMRKAYRKDKQNRANDKHRYTKEILLGLHDIADKPSIPTWPFKIEKLDSPEEHEWKTRLMNVSIGEHLRWNASHLMMGYLPMSAEEAKNAPNSCNERTKHHLCLVDWDKLPKENTDYQKYDYIVVATSIDLHYESKN